MNTLLEALSARREAVRLVTNEIRRLNRRKECMSASVIAANIIARRAPALSEALLREIAAEELRRRWGS